MRDDVGKVKPGTEQRGGVSEETMEISLEDI